MKTTLELPDALVSEIRLRAEHQREELKDTVAELLRQGLAASADVPEFLDTMTQTERDGNLRANP